MQKIPISLAEAEMVLGRDVFKNDSPAGIPICGKGTVLTTPLIMRLQNMGVQSIYVEGHPVHQEGDKSLDEQLVDLEKRFAKTVTNRLNMTLLEIYRRHLTASMGDESGRAAE